MVRFPNCEWVRSTQPFAWLSPISAVYLNRLCKKHNFKNEERLGKKNNLGTYFLKNCDHDISSKIDSKISVFATRGKGKKKKKKKKKKRFNQITFYKNYQTVGACENSQITPANCAIELIGRCKKGRAKSGTGRSGTGRSGTGRKAERGEKRNGAKSGTGRKANRGEKLTGEKS
ncbi:hypothetical protein POVCU1_014440 [Plasmodium ovale curtisi]|uniref:Uncharacterized protein n=1 Tax=Plasmodium ovale curtisi TaxID=864141 RepID=A0A1A8W384_PLAOA|nr:hypothetical protein POVCU1_014440 [Plasmodium ovale curtisi]